MWSQLSSGFGTRYSAFGPFVNRSARRGPKSKMCVAVRGRMVDRYRPERYVRSTHRSCSGPSVCDINTASDSESRPNRTIEEAL